MMPSQGRQRVERHVISESNNEIIFELVDDDFEPDDSSSGDEIQPHPEENPSAPSQLV